MPSQSPPEFLIGITAMKKFGSSAALALYLFFVPQSGAAERTGIPSDARPLTTEAVRAIYSGKTWMWANGAGYFAPDQHFVAWCWHG